MCVCLALIIKKRYNKPNVYFSFYSIFCVYAAVLISKTLFPIMVLEATQDLQQNVYSNMNLIPFKNFLAKTNVMNIVMTMPLGFGLPFIAKVRSIKPILITAILCGFVIELIQFMTAIIIGFSFRSIDINDVLCNFVGVIIGYYLLMMMGRILVNVFRDLIKKGKVFDYIYGVALSLNKDKLTN